MPSRPNSETVELLAISARRQCLTGAPFPAVPPPLPPRPFHAPSSYNAVHAHGNPQGSGTPGCILAGPPRVNEPPRRLNGCCVCIYWRCVVMKADVLDTIAD